ncbi:MAG: hypothetical protein ABEI74_04240 [Candidatus Pacearchaeota archaeon]
MKSLKLLLGAGFVAGVFGCSAPENQISGEETMPYDRIPKKEVMNRAGVNSEQEMTEINNKYMASYETVKNVNWMADIMNNGAITKDGQEHTIWYPQNEKKFKENKKKIYEAMDTSINEGYGDHIISPEEKRNYYNEQFLPEQGVSYQKYDSLTSE